MVEQDFRQGRMALGMTQEDLAAKAGISERTVKRVEAGFKARPATARAIRDALERESSVRAVAESMAGPDGFSLPRLMGIGRDFGYRAEPFETGKGTRAWKVVCSYVGGIAYDSALRPHDTSVSPETAWAFGCVSDALIALVLLDHKLQRLEEGLAEEWGLEGGTLFVRLPKFAGSAVANPAL